MKTAFWITAFALSSCGVCCALKAAPRPGSSDGYLQIVCHQYSLEDPGVPREIHAALNRPMSRAFRDGRSLIWRATPDGLLQIDSSSGSEKLLTGKDGLPVLAITGLSVVEGGKLWLATAHGAVLFIPSPGAERRSFYFAGLRYLSDDRVFQIVAKTNAAWIRTRTGISLIEIKPYTLEQKSNDFLGRIQQRHNRYGYVAPSDLLRAGDPKSSRMRPDDNDGLWTSMYVASEILRYASTHSEEALHNARTSLKAILRLVSITGIDGYPARSLMRKGDYRDADGEWHWTADGSYEWKGDTSSDELVGHFLVYWLAYNLLPGEEDRAAIRSAVRGIANNLLEHHLQLVGYGGRVTTWGRYDFAYLKSNQSHERALDSVELLSHLRVAYQITRDKKFLDAYTSIGRDQGYVQNIMHAEDDKDEEINYSDEELDFLSFYPLMNTETDPALRSQYQSALSRRWLSVRSEQNPLWDLIYAQSAQVAGSKIETYDCANAVDVLHDIPMSTVQWKTTNSQRADLEHAPTADRAGEAQSKIAIHPSERPLMKWNGNPFQMDSKDRGTSEDDGVFFLLPYWLGRYYHLLDCPKKER